MRQTARERERFVHKHCCANINHVDSHKIIRADHSQSPQWLSTNKKNRECQFLLEMKANTHAHAGTCVVQNIKTERGDS